MNTKLTATSIAIIALILVSTPFLIASATNPSLSWSTQTLSPTQTTIATIGLATDSNCKTTYSGVLTVTQPDGANKATYTVTNEPCGKYVSATYPSQFIGVAATTEYGTYTATFIGTTANGGTFNLQDNFVVNVFCAPEVVTVTETVTVTASNTQTITTIPSGSITVEVLNSATPTSATFTYPGTTHSATISSGTNFFTASDENVPAGTTTLSLTFGSTTLTFTGFPTTPTSTSAIPFSQNGVTGFVWETES